MKKDMISIIVGNLKKDRKEKGVSETEEASEEVSEDEDSSDVALESAADSLIEAIQDEDTTGVIEALKSFIDLYKAE